MTVEDWPEDDRPLSGQAEADWLYAQHFGIPKQRPSRFSVWMFRRYPAALMSLALVIIALVVWAPVVAGAVVALVLLAVAVRMMLTAGDG